MKTLIPAFMLAIVMAATSLADEPKTDADAKPILERVKENPNDTKLLNEYFGEVLGEVRTLTETDADAAEKLLNEFKTTVESFAPDQAAAKNLITRVQSYLPAYQRQIDVARFSLDDLQKKLTANPDDAETIGNFVAKITQQLGSMTIAAPDKAEEQLNAAREFLKTVEASAKDDAAKRAIANSARTFDSLATRIESGKKLAAVIGKDSAPLAVEAWVNGTPLEEGDLKGKVVLLDFWAVWCGPCIATFPHLREWQEKYADKGLVIIGLTNYYNFAWDDDAGSAKRSNEKVASDVELKMLEKFAESHGLHHRFAIQKDRSMAEYYAVSGIPHVVLIDQEQKVRLMRVGSGDANARDLEGMIKELLGVKDEQ